MRAMEAVLQATLALIDIQENSSQYCRSVLDKNGHRIVGRPTKHDVMWSQGENRFSKYNDKARVRDLEMVKGKIVRACDVRKYVVRGRE